MEIQAEYDRKIQSKQREIYNHYGLNHQLEKLKEECLELALGILHRDKPGNENFRNVVEEMADVKNLIEQIELQNLSIEDGIRKWIDVKTDRELDRIKKESEEPRLKEYYL